MDVGQSSEQIESLWTAEDLAAYLKFRNVQSIGNMVRDGRITKADGLIKINRVTRFHRARVIARIDAGLFAKGLDENGLPVNGNGKKHRL